MTRTLAIVGKAMVTRDFAPYDDPWVDIWAYNDFAMRRARRVTGAFEMHRDCLDAERYSKEYKDWLQQPHDFPIWMHEHDPRVPSSMQFPRFDIGERFGRHIWRGAEEVRDFYTSSTPYALALGIYLGYPRIELYGIELSADEGYYYERDCVFFWMGKASVLGIDIVIRPESNLFAGSLYGN